MDEQHLTGQQRDAAECPGRRVLVIAGAGCGKTATLVERYVSILRKGDVDVQGIAAITFTEKAASELKQRVRERLQKAANAATTNAERARWREHVLAMDLSEVGTIHSFCGNILREFPVQAGVDPRFGVVDGMEAGALLDMAVRDSLFEAVTEGNRAALRLLDGIELSRLSKALSASVIDCETVRVFRGSLAGALSDEGLLAAEIRKRAFDVARRAADEAMASADFSEAVAMLRGLKGPKGNALEEYRKEFLDAYDRFEQDAGREGAHRNVVAMRDAIGNLSCGSRKAWGGSDKLVVAALKAARDSIEREAGLIEGVYEDDWPGRAREVAAFLALHDLCLAAYTKAKDAQALLDFDDLVIRSRDLLCGSDAVARELANRYKFILVDEFQDTDHVQEEIIRRLADLGSNVFVVGDPEQSIYGFRGAEVEVFEEVRRRHSGSGTGVVKTLTGNHRTLPHIVEFVNALFSKACPLVEGAPEWRTPHRQLEAERASAGRTVDVMMTGEPAEPEEDVEPKSLREARRIEAQAIARRIQEIVSSDAVPVFVKNERGEYISRRAKCGDIAILLRSMTYVSIYERALQEAGVRYYTVAGATFYQRYEVKDVINLLRFVLDHDDSLSLVGALRSPLFAVSDDYLAALACERPLTEYFDGAAPPAGGGADGEAFGRAGALVRDLRALKGRISARELIERVFDATGLPAALSMLFAGRQRVANVYALRDAAAAFDAAGRGTMEDFVARISELEMREAREGEALVEALDSDVVKIMTIHAAKGLEFPIVTLADMGRGESPGYGPAEIDRALGVCLKARRDDENPYYNVMRRARRDREDAEEKRVFYVGATRARDHLILSGAAAGKPGGWMAETFRHLGIDATTPHVAAFDSFDVAYSCPSTLSRGAVAGVPSILALGDRIIAGEALGGEPSAGAEVVRKRVAPAGGTRMAFDSLTATRIETFCQCPLRFELAYLRRLPPDWKLSEEPPLRRASGIVIGTLLHAALELVRPGEGLAAALDRAIAADPLWRPWGERYRAECGPILSRLEETTFYKRIEKAGGERERAFSFLFEGRLLEGKIDRCMDGVIVDFKSDDIKASDAPAHAERYRAQMDVYALAFERLTGAAPRTAIVHFLRPGVSVEWGYGAEGIGAAAERVKAIIDQIEAGPPYLPVARGGCCCEYATLCEILYERRSTAAQGPRPGRT